MRTGYTWIQGVMRQDGKMVRVILYLVLGLAIFLAGFFTGKNYAEKNYVLPEPETKIITQTVQEIQYVPKTSANDADVEITNLTPTVKVDGEKFEFKPIDGEKFKFDKGKLDVRQGYEIEIINRDTTPKWGMNFDYTNHGIVAGAEYNFNKHVAVHGESTVKKAEGKDSYYGIGLTVRF